jgi:hypothetical protein
MWYIHVQNLKKKQPNNIMIDSPNIRKISTKKKLYYQDKNLTWFDKIAHVRL